MNVFQSTSFKESNNMVVKKTTEQRFMENDVYQLSHGGGNIDRSKLYQ